MYYRSLGTLREVLGEIDLPAAVPRPDLPDFLDQIYLMDLEFEPITLTGAGNTRGTMRLALPVEVAFELPTQAGLRVIIGDDSLDDHTLFGASFLMGARNRITFNQIPVRLRFSNTLLQPLRRVTGQNMPVRYEPDPAKSFVEISLGLIDLTFDTVDGLDFDFTSAITLLSPIQIGDTQLIIDNATVVLADECLICQWTEPNINRFLASISPALVDEGPPASAQMTLRLLLGESLQEVLLEWQIEKLGRSFRFPGLKVQTPAGGRFSLLLRATPSGLDDLSLLVTLPGNSGVVAESTFAWGRGEDRELQNDSDDGAPTDPLFRLALTTQPTRPVSLLLLQFNLSSFRLPTFFRQLAEPLPAIDINSPTCEPITFAPVSLNGDDWLGKFSCNLDAFKLPFLKDDADDASQNVFPQAVRLDTSALANTALDLDFAAAALSLPVGVIVDFGPLTFATEILVGFNWETFALTVDHSKGLDLVSDRAAFAPKEHLGLTWWVAGAPVKEGVHAGKFHYFTLVTDKYDYQVRLAPGARIELDYTRASAEPITFAVTEFALKPKGVDLTAEVTDRPAKLNGLNTRFRFYGTRLVITDNRIADFTLTGSGPLPPDLVGDAMADIHLQFAQRDGSLTLIAGGAQLRGNKLLDCKGTRFQFSVDALGLKFVNDGRFHLYFTLTGSAQFVLAAGDDREGALALLPKIKIAMVECPLTGDASVISQHVKFLIELPTPVKFSFLACFEFELRGFGFLPQAKEFDGDGAMMLSGQVKFAQGAGDVLDARIDFHNLILGLPAPGGIFPRLHFEQLAVNISMGAAFKLAAVVNFVDRDDIKGFEGEGMLEIQGLPSFAASFGFMRVRRNAASPWVRAWFIYLEARRMSIPIPYLQIYIRELGLGFGYRYTLASIKAADLNNDVRKLLQELKALAKTQGDLSRRDRWSVDVENAGEDVRWTIVLKALFAQSSASVGLFDWNPSGEQPRPSVFLFDVIIAFRSDLTFFMATRGWLNTNYFTYDANTDNAREKPLFAGFILLSVRQKRFLANLSSNKEAFIGNTPPLPDFVKTAIRGIRFSATLLIEPGLFHFELGWPNMLGWDLDLGILKVKNTGGFIFRITEYEMIIGISYASRGTLEIKGEVDLGLVGVRISARADVAWGARLIARLGYDKPDIPDFDLYGAIGLELRIEISIDFWLRIPLAFTDIKLDFRFSLAIGFTAGLEIGMNDKVITAGAAGVIGALAAGGFGLRGTGTLSLAAMGHSLQVSVKLGLNEDVVNAARDVVETAGILNLGLEATEVEGVPGIDAGGGGAGFGRRTRGAGLAFTAGAGRLRPDTEAPMRLEGTRSERVISVGAGEIVPAEPVVDRFEQPGYSLFVIRPAKTEDWGYFVLFPRGESPVEGLGENIYTRERGFLPPPPLNVRVKLTLIANSLNLRLLPDDLRDRLALPAESRLLVRWYNALWQVDETVIQQHTPANGRAYLDVQRISTRTLFSRLETYTAALNLDALYLGALPASVRGFFFQAGVVLSRDVRVRVEQRSAVDADFLIWDVNSGACYRLRLVFRRGAPISTVTLTAFPGDLVMEEGEPLRIPADLETLALENNELPDSLKSLLPENLIITPDAAVPDQWTATDLAEKPTQTLIIRRVGDVLEVNAVVTGDFALSMPAASAGFELLYYDRAAHDWAKVTANNFTWSVNWQAVLFPEATTYDVSPDSAQVGAARKQAITLADYLRNAFKRRSVGADGAPLPDDVLILAGDPTPPDIAVTQEVHDDRVYSPTDNAFEAAVRGAFEQFAGSPYFKHDPNNPYDGALAQAFNNQTTIYTGDGKLPEDARARLAAQNTEQAMQLRGMVIQDMVADVRAYAEDDAFSTADSIAFQMGLVFRFRGERPAWLDAPQDAADQRLILTQRKAPESTAPDGEPRPAEPFNLVSTDFARNPPQFQRVQHLTDAATIAITWDLTWANPPAARLTPAQAEPEHHLVHYIVQRRALDGSEREVIYTVKNAAVLTRREDGTLALLRPRFQVVDHFAPPQGTLDDLPTEGRSYLYTITPVDFTGAYGRPLTLVATRRPSAPPPVPTDAELMVRYRLPVEALQPQSLDLLPRAVVPDAVIMEWTNPVDARLDRPVPIKDYKLILRREPTLPIGSYGLDSATQRPPARNLPTSNARPLPTDVTLPLTIQPAETGVTRRRAEIDLTALRDAGVFPADAEAAWQPEAWHAFIQTVSVNGVPSALAPVELLLRVEPDTNTRKEADGIDDDLLPREDRRPAELEWLAAPLQLPLLPPEDQRAQTGLAHFPRARRGSSYRLSADPLAEVQHQPHPAGVRCVRFRWNQGASHRPDYPLDLNAGYELYQLDADAQTTDTFDDPVEVAGALRLIQEVQMLPADDLLFAPADTLTTSQWEAWYPSAIERLRTPEQRDMRRSETPYGAWYSWRDSILEWPESTGLLQPTNNVNQAAVRVATIHPALRGLIERLKVDYVVDAQTTPPGQPGSLNTFFSNTAPRTDPYGWGILQRLGLSVTFSLRTLNGEVVPGREALQALHTAISTSPDFNNAFLPAGQHPDLLRHLYVDVLFQPGKSVALAEENAQEESLLALVQVSLRPVVRQVYRYYSLTVSGPAQTVLDVDIQLDKEAACTLIDQSDPAAGETALERPADGRPLRRQITLPLHGRVTLLFRDREALTVQYAIPAAANSALTLPANISDSLKAAVEIQTEPSRRFILKAGYFTLSADDRAALTEWLNGEDGDAEVAAFLQKVTLTPLQAFAPTDERATYFTVPENLAAVFGSPANTSGGAQWRDFRRYAEALNGTEGEKITVPAGANDIAALLPRFLAWSARFFEASGTLSAEDESGTARTGPGPWLVTAYPRAGSPAYATPDASGRLKYDHLLEDQWAHNYRYYIQPYGRYDRLWHSFRQSPALNQGVRLETTALRIDFEGGLDVVLDRAYPVAEPVILSSRRLDPAVEPGQPVPPGATWEVILAQHPEQALAERNQTLARQLAFRQVAFALTRRFGYEAWIEALEKAVRNQGDDEIHEIVVQLVENQPAPRLPASLPPQPDHLDLSALTEAEAHTLALPTRIASFSAGALVLQWEALPFYYEHQLLVIAQSATTVSRVNSVIQRDFEYRSPLARGTFEGYITARLTGRRSEPFTVPLRLRRVEIPLQSFWESLPEMAQAQWPSEKPNPAGTAESRKLASLPDPEVVYQIVERFGGNIEVQMEILYGQFPDDEGNPITGYFVRQLGQNFLYEPGSLRLLTPQAADGVYHIEIGMNSIGREALSQEYNVPSEMASVLRVDANGLMAWDGVFTEDMRDALIRTNIQRITPEDRETVEAVYQDWFSSEYVSFQPEIEALPNALAALLRFEKVEETVLIWDVLQPLTPEEKAALLTLEGDAPFKTAVETLITLIEAEDAAGRTGATLRVIALLPGEGVEANRPDNDALPEILREKLMLSRVLMRYHGLITPEEAAALRDLFTLAVDQRAVARVVTTSVNKGLRGRQIMLRTRRAGASPSTPTDFTAVLLPE
ncbi:MAG: hypothetical protein OHK0046_18520 [Anaerolineae bacterium]